MFTAIFFATIVVAAQVSAYVPRLKACVCSPDGKECYNYQGIIIEKTFVITLDEEDVDFYKPLRGYALAHPNACGAEKDEIRRQLSVTHGTDGSLDIDGSVSTGIWGGGVHGGHDKDGHVQGGVHGGLGNHYVGAELHVNYDHDHGLTVGLGGHVNLGPVHVGGSVDTDIHGHASVSGSLSAGSGGHSISHSASHSFSLSDLFGKRHLAKLNI